MNKKELNHLLALAKRAILALYAMDDYDFTITGYDILSEIGVVWFVVEAEYKQSGYVDTTRFKIRVEQDKVTFLYTMTENESL